MSPTTSTGFTDQLRTLGTYPSSIPRLRSMRCETYPLVSDRESFVYVNYLSYIPKRLDRTLLRSSSVGTVRARAPYSSL